MAEVTKVTRICDVCKREMEVGKQYFEVHRLVPYVKEGLEQQHLVAEQQRVLVCDTCAGSLRLNNVVAGLAPRRSG